MARTKINAQTFPGVVVAPGGREIVYTALDFTNGNYAYLSGGEMLLVRGYGTLTVDSVADGLGREGDLTLTLPQPTSDPLVLEQFHILGPFPTEGFKQSNGSLWFNGSSTLKVAWLSTSR